MKRRLGDRRRHLRFEVIGPLIATFEKTSLMRVANIGLGGALVESTQTLPVGSEHEVRLMLGGEETAARVRVRRVIPGQDQKLAPYVIALEFLEVAAPEVVARAMGAHG